LWKSKPCCKTPRESGGESSERGELPRNVAEGGEALPEFEGATTGTNIKEISETGGRDTWKNGNGRRDAYHKMRLSGPRGAGGTKKTGKVKGGGGGSQRPWVGWRVKTAEELYGSEGAPELKGEKTSGGKRIRGAIQKGNSSCQKTRYPPKKQPKKGGCYGGGGPWHPVCKLWKGAEQGILI